MGRLSAEISQIESMMTGELATHEHTESTVQLHGQSALITQCVWSLLLLSVIILRSM